MRFLGVHPGPLMYTKVFLRLEPLGLELVAQAARRAGHEVRLIDLQVESHRAYFRLVQNWRPDVVAFSCNYLANVPEIVDLAKATKARYPRIFICVGGHSASFTASAIIEHAAGAIDCVLKGEGEAAIREFTQRCTDVLEMYVRRYPGLWLWMHRRWRDVEPATERGMFPAASNEQD